jgi:hypothetical protein
MSDKDGYRRGAKGFGKPDKTDREFLKPDADSEKLYGPDYAGKFNQVTENAQLEGDDC